MGKLLDMYMLPIAACERCRYTRAGDWDGDGRERAINPLLQILLWAVVGVGVGTYGTLVGAGGGFLMVPIFLFFIPGIRPSEATGTSLAVVLFNALSGTTSYLRQKRVDLRSGTIFGLATVPGALIGSFLSRYFASRLFYIVFGVFLIAISVFLNLRPDPKRKTLDTSGADRRTLRPGWVTRTLVDRDGETFVYTFNMRGGIVLSIVVGFLSSILGIGGGIIHVPAMVFLFNFPAHLATATSHYVLVISSLVATISNVAQGNIRWIPMSGLSVGVIIGAQLGAQLSRRIQGKWILRGLSIALAVVGVRLLFKR